MADVFPNNCAPRIINVDASTGCTLTRASIMGMTPQTFANQGFTETKFDDVIARATEARIAGVNEVPLEMLLMSRIKDLGKNAINKVNIGRQGSVILPYRYMRQRRNINANYWRVVSSAATPNAGQGNVHPGSWDYTLAVSASPWASPLSNLEQYFLPGGKALIEGMNLATGVAYSPTFTIAASVSAGTTAAKVTMTPSVTATGWAGLTAAQQAAFQLTSGTVTLMTNSVSDYESYSFQDNAENSWKLLTFWQQTSRFGHEVNDEYKKALDSAYMSGYFHGFRELPLAEQLKIQRQKYNKKWMNTCWFGTADSELQAVETYFKLPVVTDVANPSCPIEYKSNCLGIDTQITLCGRTQDLQGNALNMDNLFALGYGLKRAREADGTTIDTVDFMTNRFTAGQILSYMTNLLRLKYGVQYVQDLGITKSLTFEGKVMLQYNEYDLPPDLGGYKLAIFWDPFFDDKLAAFDAPIQSRGMALWGIDWTDVAIGLIATNSANRVTNVADALYFEVIQPFMRNAQLESTTFAPMMEDPARHLLIKNFNLACPTGSVAGCSPNNGN